MPNPEVNLTPEERSGRQIHLFTPDTLKKLNEEGQHKFGHAVDLLRASIEELRDMNGVETTDENLDDHTIIYPKSTPTAPTLQS